MCGIAGFCDFKMNSELGTLMSMTDTLTHRGPDDNGYDYLELKNAQIGLGHRRLSILDLSQEGHQPMKFESLTIVFNGEVYNFKEIREKLIENGYKFHSDSDTEVVLKGFHCWREAVVDHFIGMFAFVIYDSNEQKIYAFRDRAGVKPFYYQWQNGVFLFGSELKAFHEHPSFHKEIDTNSLSLFLQYSYIPAPYCIFKHTFKLKPGHFLVLDIANQSLSEKKYWEVIEAYNEDKLDISEKEAIDETERLLKSAYEYRLVSDVPVGVFLSGGYDSASVAALLQTGRTEKIKTFTIGFKEDEFNEAHEAKKIADYLGTDHIEQYVTPKEAEDIIPSLPDIYDEPFADNSTVPTTLVSRLAKQHVKVALSADGGDEIFAGYHKFGQSVKYTEQLPFWLQFTLSKTMGLINPDRIPYFKSKYNFSTRYEKMRRIWADHSAVGAMKFISQYITESEADKYLRDDFERYETFFDAGSQINDKNDSFNKMLAIDYKTFLVDNNLVKVDRATMAVALEGREPMLDQRIIEFVSKLPSEYKIKNGVTKHILKQVVHRYIPQELMERPKKPFIAPLTIWFKNELKELMASYIDRDKLKQQGFFDADEVIGLRDKYFNGEKLSHQKLWNILVFQMWYERWMN
ncbi:MAG: asparagine synthase (glutamine-hydrolyzing) [Bacteroidota bacterium]